MTKIKNLITNNLAIIIFALSFILDAKYQILEHFVHDQFLLNIIKGLGALMLAYFTRENLGISKFGLKRVSQVNYKDEELNTESEPEDIGGGGIKNPKP